MVRFLLYIYRPQKKRTKRGARSLGEAPPTLRRGGFLHAGFQAQEPRQGPGPKNRATGTSEVFESRVEIFEES